jgi:hypothetical protein
MKDWSRHTVPALLVHSGRAGVSDEDARSWTNAQARRRTLGAHNRSSP